MHMSKTTRTRLEIRDITVCKMKSYFKSLVLDELMHRKILHQCLIPSLIQTPNATIDDINMGLQNENLIQREVSILTIGKVLRKGD
mmetsp:Transcript_15255/g.17434  ORF Transcript_15255/g.17434 Transcript_15255/m.17434 type:complete len:86 (+) Transcript_15255:457-714(+)